MWFGGVDFPRKLVKSHHEGDLVLFVGAGASISAPSSLPSFKGLTDQVAERLGVEINRRLRIPEDVRLGRLADDHRDVHQMVHDIISGAVSSPNRLHAAIAALARAGESVRIITTNFDRHLSSALKTIGDTPREYVGPALPVGRQWDGIVYLHGVVGNPAAELIVTDRDFGRAYLTDAWAARFLEQTFSARTVLFVGYSHNDTVMRYLGRGLRPETERFVLTDEPGAARWSELGITPIEYPIGRGKRRHDSVVTGVQAWAQWRTMLLAAHEAELTAKLSNIPSGSAEEETYLAAVVEDERQVVLFTKHAQRQEWRDWLWKAPPALWAPDPHPFRSLFQRKSLVAETSAELARWFFERALATEDDSSHALTIVAEAGSTLSEVAWQGLAIALLHSPKPRPAWMAPWIRLLVANDPGGPSFFMDDLLASCSLPDNRCDLLLLLDHLSAPQYRVTSWGGRTSDELTVRGSGYWLRHTLNDIIKPHIDEIAADLLVLSEHHLRYANWLTCHGGSGGFDRLSFSRPSISQASTSFHEDVLVLVDVAREALEALLDSDVAAATAIANGWLSSDVQLLRRLGIHALARSPELSADEKILRVIQDGWLSDIWTRAEVYDLLNRVLPDTSETVSNALVSNARGLFADVENETTRNYERFNLLNWIATRGRPSSAARSALDEIRETYPEFEARARPDLLSHVTAGFVADQPFMTQAEILEAAQRGELKSVLAHRSENPSGNPFSGPTWAATLGEITGAISQVPEVGLELIEMTHGDVEILLAACVGWQRAALTVEQRDRILSVLLEIGVASIAGGVAELLQDKVTTPDDPASWAVSEDARLLASQLWAMLPEAPVNTPDSGLLGLYGSPAALLVRFWLGCVARDRYVAGDSWSGLSGGLAAELTRILRAEGSNGDTGAAMLCSRLRFVASADPPWAQQNLFPLLSAEQSRRMLLAWTGFLHGDIWSPQLVDLGLTTKYLEVVQRLDLAPDNTERLADHLAWLVCFGPIDPGPFLKQLASVAPVGVRDAWAERVSFTLGELKQDDRDEQWGRWICHYWKERLAKRPRPLEPAEAGAMFPWALQMAAYEGEAAELVLKSNGVLKPGSTLLDLITDARLSDDPDTWSAVVVHVVRSFTGQPYRLEALQRIIETLRSHGRDTAGIVEAALALGITAASDW